MKDNIFDGGIDLNELADSEDAIFDQADSGVSYAKGEEAEDSSENKDDDEGAEDDTLDISDIANMEDDPEGDTDDEPVKKDVTKTPAKEESSPRSDDMLTSLASALTEAGVFSSLEEDDLKDIKDVDSLLKAVEKQIKVNEFKSLNEDQKEYLKALENGIPLEEYSRAKANTAQYERLSDDLIKENANVGYELIRRKFIIDGVSEDKAAKYAQIAMKEDTAIEEAISAKQALIEYEKSLVADRIKEQEETKAARETKAREELAALRSKVLEANELIPGLKVNSSTKEKVYESITNPSKLDENGNPLNEVMQSYQDPEYKMRLHAVHVITKGFTDFSKIERTTKTKAIKEFEEKLKTGTVVSKTGSSIATSATSAGIKNALDGYVPAYKRQ